MPGKAGVRLAYACLVQYNAASGDEAISVADWYSGSGTLWRWRSRGDNERAFGTQTGMIEYEQTSYRTSASGRYTARDRGLCGLDRHRGVSMAWPRTCDNRWQNP